MYFIGYFLAVMPSTIFDYLCTMTRIVCIRLACHASVSAYSFYRAMLCIRGTSHGPLSACMSICPSKVGVLLKRLNVGSHKQHHTIAQGL